MSDPEQKPANELGETAEPQASRTQSGQKSSTGTSKGADGRPRSSKKKVTQLGDFRLMKKLGQGGMGEVYLANQVSLDRLVALKILSKEMAKKAGFVERFVREARAMAKIDHANAVKVYAAESDKGLHYAAIEYIDGQSMQDWMDDRGKLSVGDAMNVVLACADALNHAHELNLIHRDIKPDNILVNKKGVVKVADFGLAKALDDEDMSMTQSGTGLGTPLYMPPEQARDAKHVDNRTDIYALGCTFYYVLRGELPFKGDSVLKLIIAKEQGKYESVRKINPEVPERLALMIDKMIQKEAKHRYSSCGEMIADLEKLGLENETLSIIDGADAAGGARSARTRSRSTVSATGAGATSGGAGQTMPGYRTSEEDATATEQKSPTQDKAVWYVRFTNKKGEAQVKEMTTRQVQQGILAEALDVKAQAQKKDQGGGFLALAAYNEFQALMKKRLAKTTEHVRSDHMKDMYAKLDKEQTRRKRWRWLKNMTEGVLGGFGLIVYLAIVVVVLIAIYWVVVNVVYPKISENLEDRPAIVEPDPDAE